MDNQQNVKPKPLDYHDIFFAGGCFWGVEEVFSRLHGVVDVRSGYANGKSEDPTYDIVSRGSSGFAEAVHVRYDANEVDLRTLAELFFSIIDPLSVNKQGNDVGPQYRTGMYYTDKADVPVLQAVMDEEQKKYSTRLAVELEPLLNFSKAEEYHQQYLKKNPGGYCHINFERLNDFMAKHGKKETADAQTKVDPQKYSKPDEQTLRQTLSPEEYLITQHAGTEPPFTGRYWDHQEKGIYVDVATGEPLFSSEHKFNSSCGWPSFTRPLDPEVVNENQDRSHGMIRTEVRSRVGDSHLGHVFDDGPSDQGGLRYCINSAAIRFIPYDEMESQGYGPLMRTLK